MENIIKGILFGIGFAFIYNTKNSKKNKKGGGLFDYLKKKSSPPKTIPGKEKYESVLQLNNNSNKVKSVELQDANTPSWDIDSFQENKKVSVKDKPLSLNKWGYPKKKEKKIENKFSFRKEKIKKIKPPTKSLLALELSK